MFVGWVWCMKTIPSTDAEQRVSLSLSIFNSSQTGNVDLVWAQVCPDNLITQECLPKIQTGGPSCVFETTTTFFTISTFPWLSSSMFTESIVMVQSQNLTAQLLGVKLASSSLPLQPPHYLPWSLHALGINSKFLWQFAIDSHIAVLLLCTVMALFI